MGQVPTKEEALAAARGLMEKGIWDCVLCKDLQTQLTACQQELKEFRRNWGLMKEALEDYQKGSLSDISLITVLGGIICPPEMTKEDIEWGKKALSEYYKRLEEDGDG